MRFLLFLSVGLFFYLHLRSETAPATASELRVVGVLGNTAGLGQPAVPYAFYTGLAVDSHERLWLAGALSGLVCCDQDGKCLAIVPLPKDERRPVRSVLVSAGDAIFAIATLPHGESSALYQFDASADEATQCRVKKLAEGVGHWAVSPVRDASEQVLVGQGDLQARQYRVLALDPRSSQLTKLFEVALPSGAQAPWRHLVQAEQDGSVSIEHHGGQNFSGRFNRDGKRVGEAPRGQILEGLRYVFGYGGQLVRNGLDGRPAPGDCGAPLQELRLAAQVVQTTGRYFFVGRGGAVEAEWNGQNFEYRRRLGAIFIEDMYAAAGGVHGIAHTTAGNNDVQHPITLPREQLIGELLHEEGPLHSRQVVSLVPGPQAQESPCSAYSLRLALVP